MGKNNEQKENPMKLNIDKLQNDLIAYAMMANQSDMMPKAHMDRALRICRIFNLKFEDVCEAVKS